MAFALVGAAYWLLVSFQMAMIYSETETLFVGYWCAFAFWLIVRVFTRWREIAELRRLDAAVPTVHPPPADAPDNV